MMTMTMTSVMTHMTRSSAAATFNSRQFNDFNSLLLKFLHTHTHHTYPEIRTTLPNIRDSEPSNGITPSPERFSCAPDLRSWHMPHSKFLNVPLLTIFGLVLSSDLLTSKYTQFVFCPQLRLSCKYGEIPTSDM